MNENTLKGDWQQLKGRIREKWGKLTDDDLDVIGGRKDRLVGRLRERYGQKQEEAEQALKEFEDANFEPVVTK
jgi:uncharacterized protein YjbJ (UPF0337 family)